jgi:hypothetical protein
MTTYVYRNGGLIEKHLAGPRHDSEGAPFVISDIMDSTRHMATGRFHTSKAAFRADTRAAGCIEVGNEASTLLKPRQPLPLSREERRNDIRKSIYQLRNGR